MYSNLTSLLEINLELCTEWNHVFIDNIYMRDLRPNKWLKNSRLSVMDEVVFVFNDSDYGIGIELCNLAILRTYFLVSYNTIITQCLTLISKFF